MSDTASRPGTPIGEREAASVDDTATIIGISSAMVWKLIRQQKLQPIKIGKRTLITASERRRFLEAAA